MGMGGTWRRGTSCRTASPAALACLGRPPTPLSLPLPLTPTPRASLAAGQGPYFYLPKMESHLEARLWNDTFNLAQVRACACARACVCVCACAHARAHACGLLAKGGRLTRSPAPLCLRRHAPQDMMRVPRGTIRATVLIETLLASFEMVGGRGVGF